MYQINFNKPVKIHFMGIGGISMSGLAEILSQRLYCCRLRRPRICHDRSSGSLLASRLPMASAPRILHLISMWLSIPLPFIQITLNLPLPKQRSPDDGPCGTAWPDYDQLCQCHRRFRYPRQDNNNLYAVSYSSGRRD